MKSIIVTGCAGMLGSNFCDWLVKNHPEYKIIGIDNLFGGYLDNVNPMVEFYPRDAGSNLRDIFEQNDVEYFYSFHSFSAEGLSPFVRKFNYRNNLVSLANIVNYCIEFDVKLIFASSMSVYGVGAPPFKETDVCKPIDSYGIGKYACELDIQAGFEHHGLRYSIIRPHNIIGEKQNIWDRYRNVIGIFMRKLLNDEPLTIYGDGNQTRAFSWVHDYCEPFWKVAVNDYSDPIFNCGGDKHYTLNQVAEILFEITGKNTGIQYLEPRHEVKNAYCDHTKVKEILGYEDKTDLRYMLTVMWEWAQKQKSRTVTSMYPFIELKKGLYSFWDESY